MLAELKWLIPTCAAVAIAALALIRGQVDSIPWSRAFIIGASLLIATTPIIASGKLGKDGLEITTLSQTAADSAAALHKLDERISTNENRIAEIRNLVTTLTAALPPATSPENKAKVEAQIKALGELTAKSSEFKTQFDMIKQNIDRQVLTLPGVKFRF
jgi:hypothetical protein